MIVFFLFLLCVFELKWKSMHFSVLNFRSVNLAGVKGLFEFWVSFCCIFITFEDLSRGFILFPGYFFRNQCTHFHNLAVISCKHSVKYVNLLSATCTFWLRFHCEGFLLFIINEQINDEVKLLSQSISTSAYVSWEG